MKLYLQNFAKVIKRHPYLTIIIIVVILALAWFYFSRKKAALEYETVKFGNVIEEVDVTGKVKAAQSVDLAFEKSGRVANIAVKVGDKVSQGELLVALENADLRAQLEEAQANAKAAESKLNDLKKGTRPEEIQIDEVKVSNAASALVDEKASMVAALKDAYTKSDDAVRNKVDAFFSNPRGANPKLTFSLSDSQLQIDLESSRLLVENTLNIWSNSLDLLTASGDLNKYFSVANNNLNTIKTFLDKSAFAANSLSANNNISQATIDQYRSNISTGRVNVNTAVSNLSSENSALTGAQSSLSLAQNELNLARAGHTPEEISSEEATLEGLYAAADSVRAQISKTIIYAPFSGVVTRQDAKIGAIAAPSSALVSLISGAKFQIEAFVPEVDIAKIKLSDAAAVTLDAYGEEVKFEAAVARIDPAETVIEGVSTYKVTLEFSREDSRILSGMTANIIIATNRREGVIYIPQRLVASRGDKKYISVVAGQNQTEEREIKTGLRGSDGNIEITEGLKEGEKILISAGSQ